MATTKPKKSNAGRPSKMTPDICEQARKLCLLGATDVEMADFFGVCEATFNNWKRDYPEFLESLKEGKIQADANVANSLYNRAIGYSHAEDKVFNNNGTPLIVPTIKHYPPCPTSIAIWLNNRQSAKWKRQQQEAEEKDGIAEALLKLIDKLPS